VPIARAAAAFWAPTARPRPATPSATRTIASCAALSSTKHVRREPAEDRVTELGDALHIEEFAHDEIRPRLRNVRRSLATPARGGTLMSPSGATSAPIKPRAARCATAGARCSTRITGLGGPARRRKPLARVAHLEPIASSRSRRLTPGSTRALAAASSAPAQRRADRLVLRERARSEAQTTNAGHGATNLPTRLNLPSRRAASS
jgi:hypothetical protein